MTPRESEPGFSETDSPAPQFLAYEDIVAEIFDAATHAGLRVDDMRHDMEPSIGERRFECTVRMDTPDQSSKYHAHISFTWDALMTFVSTYGPGRECELYHDADDLDDCPHQMIDPDPLAEIEVEFVLGDGGYELQDIGEIPGWVESVSQLFNSVFPDNDGPSVHVGMAIIGSTTIIEKFSAEHSWLVNVAHESVFDDIARQVHAVLRIAPSLADRLPF